MRLAALSALLIATVVVDARLPNQLLDARLGAESWPTPPVTQAHVPESFSWRDIPGHGSLLTASMNQHVPQYCGACFAFGAFHTLQDRVKIARLLFELDADGPGDAHSGPDLVSAVQVLLNCNNATGTFAGSCAEGGSAAGVWQWVRDFGGVPAAGCQPYLAMDGQGCAAENVCRNCMPARGAAWTERKEYECWAVPGDAAADVPCAGSETCSVSPYPRIAVSQFGRLPDPKRVGLAAASLAIQAEIARRGPVTCDVDATAFLAYAPSARRGVARGVVGSVIVDPVGNRSEDTIDHVIEVVGWGLERVDAETVPYWEIRNSWGEYWGDTGFGRVRRGANDAFVESRCHWVHPSGWGVPQSEKWQNNPVGATDDAAADLVAASEASLRPNLAKISGGVHAPAILGTHFFVLVLMVVFSAQLYVMAACFDPFGAKRGACASCETLDCDDDKVNEPDQIWPSLPPHGLEAGWEETKRETVAVDGITSRSTSF